MNVLVFLQPQRGGTNVVLHSASKWLTKQGHDVTESDFFNESLSGKYDLALLPTSEMYRLALVLSESSRIKVRHVLVWAMGSRSFNGAFTNQMNISLTYRVVTLPLRKLANKTLESLLYGRAIIFTDEVGMYADVGHNKGHYIEIDDLIYPIPVDVQFEGKVKSSSSRPKRFMWIGRIDKDFKVLPLLRIIQDVTTAKREGKLNGCIEFLIVGSGDSDILIKNEIDQNNDIDFRWLKWVALSRLNEL
ncbi:MAG: hypothetical protein WBB23_25920, partial [Desulforhopalus sp.]